ncbi:MAG: trypsin-like peptidase domain-containing protein, partial [Halocynthiibacter sp.]
MTSRAIMVLILGFTLVLAQTIMAAARSAPESFADLAEQVSPSVVNITTSTVVASRGGPAPVVPEGSPFEDFFREFNDRNQQGGDGTRPPSRSQALGSGFLISEDGYIVTNAHVVSRTTECKVIFSDGRELDAVTIAVDTAHDLAVLGVDSPEPLKALKLGRSD